MFEIKSDKIETVNKTFRIPKDLALRLEELAQQKGISMNGLIVQCCEYALDNLKTDDIPIGLK
jgi:predicted HicB family RNase H-like nuclease